MDNESVTIASAAIGRPQATIAVVGDNWHVGVAWRDPDGEPHEIDVILPIAKEGKRGSQR